MTDSYLDDWGADLSVLLHASRWPINFDAITYRLRHEDRFALEMRLCNEWHMPHSVFSDWQVDDQDKALAMFVYERQRCTGCGIHPMDWPDPTEPMFTAEAEVCPGCAETDRYQRHLQEQAETLPKSASDGVRVVLRKLD